LFSSLGDLPFSTQTNKSIPEEFSYDDMLVTTLPGTEVAFASATIIPWTSALDIVRAGSGSRHAIITGSDQIPGKTNKDLYPDSDDTNKWVRLGQFETTGFYMWHYTGY
jgi:hypothetical protein